MTAIMTKMGAACGPSSIDPTAFIHPLAHVDGVTIGARTRVWQFASVVRNAVLGEDCSVASGVTVDGAHFGDRCVISQGVTTAPGLKCGDDVFLGPNVSICNDRWPRTHKGGFNADIFGGSLWAVVVRDGASVGARSVVLPGVLIGARAMVAAGSVVTRNVPDDHLWTREGHAIPIDTALCTPRMKLVTD